MAELSSTVMKVPQFAVPALLEKDGKKVKDVELTSGASIVIFRLEGAGAWAQVTISGTKSATSLASLLVKMAVLHARAADHIPEPSLYTRDKKEEAQLDMYTFYTEINARAFNTKHPQSES